jgi:phenylalanyl-tRNA synthetase beta chain
LICEIAGGKATENAIDVYPKALAPKVVTLRPVRVTQLTSIAVDAPEIIRILGGLGFERNGEAATDLTFRVPSWRVDVDQEEDLVEEVARHTGYSNIGSELPPSNMSGEYQPSEFKQRTLRRALNSHGYDEAINFSFIRPQEHFESIPTFPEQTGPIELENPIIEDASSMRKSLLPGLLDSVRHNMNQGLRDVSLFEIGRVFNVSAEGGLPDERLAMAMAATGGALNENVAEAPRELDFFDIKGALETAVDWMNLAPLTFKETSVKHLRQGQAGLISMDSGQRIGTIGRLAEDVAASYKFRQPVFVVELDFSSLLNSDGKVVQYSRLPKYPSVVRDLTLVVDRSVTFAELRDAVRDQQISDFKRVSLVGTYDGSNIPPGKRSITLRMEYRSDERTLRDDEVEERQSSLTAFLVDKFGAEQH